MRNAAVVSLLLLAAWRSADAEEARHVIDQTEALPPAVEQELESLLSAFQRERGIRVLFLTTQDPLDLSLDGDREPLRSRWDPEQDGRGRSILLASSWRGLEWHVGEPLRPQIDAKTMLFVGEQIAPFIPHHSKRTRDYVAGTRISLAIFADRLDERTSWRYLAWKLLSSDLDSAANDGLQAVAVAGFRYLMVVAFELPLLLGFLALAWLLLRRRLSRGIWVLLQLGIMVPVVVAGFAAGVSVEDTDWEILGRYLAMAAVVFVFSFPVHLLATMRLLEGEGPVIPLFPILYLLFPLMVAAMAALARGESSFHRQLRQMRYLWRTRP